MRPQMVGPIKKLAMATARWWFAPCERACDSVIHEAKDLMQCGKLPVALSAIDTVDARCRCSRFTSGDSPPQYTLAFVCLKQMLNEGRDAEVEELLNMAQGQILKDFGKQKREGRIFNG